MMNSTVREQGDNRRRSFKPNPSGLEKFWLSRTSDFKRFICRCPLVYILLYFLIYRWGGCFIIKWESLLCYLEANSNMISILANLCVIGGVIYSFYAWGRFRWKRRIVRDFLKQCDKITKTISEGLTQITAVNNNETRQTVKIFRELHKLANTIFGIESKKGKVKTSLEHLERVYKRKISKRISLDWEMKQLEDLKNSFKAEIAAKTGVIDLATQKNKKIVGGDGSDDLKSGSETLQRQVSVSLKWISDELNKDSEYLQRQVSVFNDTEKIQGQVHVSLCWNSHELNSEELQKQVSASLKWIEDNLKKVNAYIDEIRVKILERMGYM